MRIVNYLAAAGLVLSSSVFAQAGTTVQFAKDTFTVNEAAGTAEVSVVRTGSLAGPASVSFATFNGTARAGSDFSDVSGTLVWEDLDGEAKTITVPIVNDGAEESVESFEIRLTSPVGASLGAPNVATVEILDDDGAVAGAFVQFVTASSSVAENAGSVQVQVARSGAADQAASVSYSLTGNTATPTSDFADVSGVLTWSAGDSAPKSISIGIVNDTSIEGTETFNVNLSNPVGVTLGSPSTATVSIIDDETAAPGSLRFERADVAAAENAGTVSLLVRRVNGGSGAVSVAYTVANGTALQGTDYNSSGGRLTWAANDVADKSINIELIDNELVDGERTFTATLADPTGGATIGSPATVTVRIIDDELGTPGLISFREPVVQAVESSGQALLFVDRTEGSAGALEVDFITVSQVAISGSDFTQTAGTLTWDDGDAGTKVISIPLLDDSVVEESESFRVELLGARGGAQLVADRSKTTVVILDDDEEGGIFGLSTVQETVNIEEGSVRIGVSRTGGAGGDVSVVVSAISGTATLGTDFSLGADGSETLTWAAREAGEKFVTITLSPAEPGTAPRSFTVSLSNNDGGTIDPAASTTQVVVRYPRSQPNTGIGAGALGGSLMLGLVALGLARRVRAFQRR